MSSTLTHTSLPKLTRIAQGKVRDIYALPDQQDEDKLLFVATDRISAFDIIMENGIPGKGALLTKLSLFWFQKLQHIIPNHVIAPSIPTSTSSSSPSSSSPSVDVNKWIGFPSLLDEYKDQLERRSMIVKKCQVIEVEAIVRGYITGSAWSEYKKSQTVHGIPMPSGLQESEKFPVPIFTPSTKADLGEHDENIHPDKVKDICGEKLAKQIEEVALKLYTEAADYALTRGIILADTKFEFGLLPSPAADTSASSTLILIDEVLTPDSSRYWSAETYVVGKSQDSFDKQYVRDWLIKEGKRNVEGVKLPDDVVVGTARKYQEAVDKLMG